MKEIINITGFHIEESVQNKGAMLLIATDEKGQKWIVSGDPHFPTYLSPYQGDFYTDETKKVK